ncbi:MAG: DNA polymerase III subunit epsilon [Rhodobacterales bacterium 32-67-9]|nr:MAG: DNA polymerase III subunit epsilon [Rhodobacterales bacterium 32-67-9]
MLDRLSLRQRLLLFFAAIAAGGIAALAAGLWVGYHRLGMPQALSDFVLVGAVAGFALLGVVTWVWFLFDENVGRALDRLAAGLRAQAHAEGAGAFDPGPARYLGDLGPASAAVSASLAETRTALAAAVERETGQLKSEKARLETLLSDVPAGVLLCSGAHQLVFYNGPATDLLGAGAAPGLDRKVFDYLREAPLTHAYDRLVASGDPDAVSDLMVATRDGARVLSGRMRLLEAGAERPGYVLTLRDVTADLAAHAGRDRLLEEIFDRIRRPAANLQTVIGVIAEAGGGEALNAALLQEVGSLARTVNELGERYDAARGGWSALPATRAADLADGLRARVEAAGLGLTVEAADLVLHCDGFEIVALLAGVARRLAEAGHARDFRAEIAEDGAGAVIGLSWEGAPLAIGRLEAWLAEPIDEAAEVTGRGVLATHATECWPEAAAGRAAIRLPIREARRASRSIAPISRRVVYDFDLLFRPHAAALSETPLENLTYVVFDSETTGLLPDEGDEVCQIAGLRLVNGRRVAGEVFDMLVNPGRTIPPKATAVHGISDAMVAEAPGVVEAVARFHKFAEGAVLIAHNAPFDMTFLKRREPEIGAVFDHPILDTVLLSAVVYGQTEVHSLDALSRRLGITIPEEARHTAIGDTIATAEAFLKLLPMLKGKGLVTFGDVLAEVRKHGRLLKDLNA